MMVVQKFQKVYSVNSAIQAAVIQATLERAGIPVCITKSGAAYLDVMVPEEFIYDAQNILYPVSKRTEIFFAPAAA